MLQDQVRETYQAIITECNDLPLEDRVRIFNLIHEQDVFTAQFQEQEGYFGYPSISKLISTKVIDDPTTNIVRSADML